MSLSLYAQNTVTLQGLDFQVVSGNEYFFTPRTNDDYNDINENDLNSYLRAFVRDAVLAGEDLNLWLDPRIAPQAVSQWETGAVFRCGENQPDRYYVIRTNTIEITTNTYWCLNPAPVATAWASDRPGYAITINANSWHHRRADDKRRIMYHELGHDLLYAPHLCETVDVRHSVPGYSYIQPTLGIMGTGARSGPNSCPTYTSVTGYDFRLWSERLRHMFENLVRNAPVSDLFTPSTKRSRILTPIDD